MLDDMIDNRITRATTELADRITRLDADKVAALEEAAELDGSDWLVLGDKFSRGLLAGMLTPGEAQRLHAIHTDYYTDTTLAEKIIMMQASAELLAARV